MKSILCLASVLIFTISCAHTSSSERNPAQDGTVQETVKTPPLRADETTIWTLQELAQKGRLDILEDLFNNHGINLEKVPEGYAAGAGARVFDLGTPLFAKALDSLTGANWRGKIFFPSENPRKSMGLNRIRHTLLLKTSVTPMASFVTQLLDKHPLVPKAKSNVVILNYAKPNTKGYWQEWALTQIQVYDVMVAVPGRYGPVFIGKTWLGSYADNRTFNTDEPNRLIAWFFLDFNSEAVAVQQKEHWDGSKEKILNPVPYMRAIQLPVMPD
ncbi:hypothetical protein [Bdellovibrio sp. HCB337]|uniref:hypothetical protein n=1 Tax=Bdellovibrio sp. HCB337 TaxID=3394358 RepID=UPI0039A52D00